MRSRKVLKCCCASTVVGTRTATCRPSMTALNAARMPTSVLPKPTSPQIKRSIGLGRSMSGFVSTIARIGWRVLDHQTFPPFACGSGRELGRFGAEADRKDLQTQVASDAVLQMHDVIPLLQVGEVDVESRARRQGVRRFQPARALDLVA